MNAIELKQWRKKWEITQVELARMLGTHQVTVARWETGARKVPFLLPLALEALEQRMKKEATTQSGLSVNVKEVK